MHASNRNNFCILKIYYLVRETGCKHKDKDNQSLLKVSSSKGVHLGCHLLETPLKG